MAEETYEQQMRDSEMIFRQVTSADFTLEEARRLLAVIYIPDMSISRSGISHALGRLERHYKGREQISVIGEKTCA